MGIKDFYKYVKTRWPECFTAVRYDHFRYQRIALDMMNLLYVFRARSDLTWMQMLLQYLQRLRHDYVHVVCVFDSNQPHPLKQATVEKRREDREKGRRRVQTLRVALERYEHDGLCPDELHSFLQSHPECVSALTQKPIPGAIRDHMLRLQRAYSLSFRSEEIQAVQDLLRALGYCVLQAEYDGEALCAYLSAQGVVDAVLSNDSDVFFFGATRVLFRFTDDGAYLIDADTLLQQMELTRAQFIELCLLCGTDFNASVRGIGFCRAYALVQQYPRTNVPDFPLSLDHTLLDQVRAFTDASNGTAWISSVHYCRPPSDRSAIAQLAFRHHIDLSLDDLVSYRPVSIVLDLEDSQEPA